MSLNINESIKNRGKVEDILKDMGQPITEQANQLTTNIDLVQSGKDIIKLLAKTDQQILDGWQIKENLKTDGLKTDFYILDKLNRISRLLADNWSTHLKQTQDEKFKFILSGCGTSGRLAYLCSQTLNAYMKKVYNYEGDALCDYIIAGDDFALVNSVESVEDKPKIGAEKLKERLGEDGLTKCIYIGITCGLSAPFVAGQIDFCLNNPDLIVACGLMGFNPIGMTRKTNPVNDRKENFYDLALKMKELESKNPNKYFILNPFIGPEPITGSSRMKSGTTTKIMLDIITSKALYSMDHDGEEIKEMVLLNYYQDLLDKVVYSIDTMQSLSLLVDKAGSALRNLSNGGSLNYLCDSERLGFLCCVDASECVPTYGAAKNDVKGFISARNGVSLSSIKETNHVWSGFINTCDTTWSQIVLDTIDKFNSSNCLFVLVDDDSDCEFNEVDSILTKKGIEKELLKTKCQIVHLNMSSQKSNESINLNGLNEILDSARQKVNPHYSKCLQEFVLKLCINAISTGAHVLIGKTYENMMIDVKVSNIKLYYRAIGILNKFSNRPKEECELMLLRSIYEGSFPDDASQIEAHIERATSQNLILPKALIMLLIGCDYSQSVQMLTESNNSVRNCIYKLKNLS